MLGIIILQVVLIGLNAVFACAEIAVLSVSDTKLEKLAEEGNKKAKRLFRLTREPAKFLATIQVAITLSGFLGSAFAADNFSEPLVEWILHMGVKIPKGTLDAIAVVIITLILSYFTLVFGELVPKRMAMKRSEQLALGISGLVSGISTVFKPIVWLLTVSTNGVLRIMGIDPNEIEEEVSEEEIRMLVDAGSEKGTIDEQEKEFIQNVFEFDDLTAKDIATHRTEVVILWMEDPVEQWDETIHTSRHTLYPVCKDSPDNVVGILNAKDYFRLAEKTKEAVVELVKPAFFVPDTVAADVLFRKMRQTRNSMSVVLDEYGGMVGIVTITDLLEELVGEITDEDTKAEEASDEPHMEQIGENTWAIIGSVELQQIEQMLNVDIAQEDVDTLTGLVFGELDMIPDDGEQDIELEWKGLHIRITQVEDHRIAYAVITKLPESQQEDED
ncbi:MAG: HlyC/CorC family transporter [Oscillospiraceae bacterium]|nr:HlyC/CorC family transporter [Oscillospiraceae bacterium]